ncbi:GDP/GTP exchange factor for ARF [Globomyces sp. JEL0801]|nr:GDP/GTP exchange factor for ARF [Globomyces sp. JEL0801]
MSSITISAEGPTPTTAARYKPELNWSQIVQSEIVSVTNAMRRTQRWNKEDDEHTHTFQHSPLFKDDAGMSNVKEFLRVCSNRTPYVPGSPMPSANENILLLEFTKLKSILSIISNLRDLDPSVLLHPFLEVIKSGDTTGAITGVALNSVQTFINYRILDPHHPDIGKAFFEMTHAVTRCKFEATDVVSDEVVLTKILTLLRTMALSESGKKSITDKGICEMVEVAFGMHFQNRISELLRKSAADTLLVLTQCMFEREAEHRESMKFKGSKPKSKSGTLTSEGSMEEFGTRPDPVHFPLNQLPSSPRKSPPKQNMKPFGVPAILEFIRVLISLIDPKDNRHTDTLHRSLALRLATRGLEVGGVSLSKWVGLGFAIELENERLPTPNEPEQELTMPEMTITTDVTPTVVTVGAHGAEYGDGNPAIVEVRSPKLPVLEAPPNTAELPFPNPPSKNTMSGATVAETLEPLESDFQKLAVNIKHMVVDDFCRYLFQLLQLQNTTVNSPPSWVGLNIISLITRTISTLLSTMRDHLIPQQEWFIHFLMRSYESGVMVWDIDEWMASPTFKENVKSKDANPTPLVKGGPVLVSEVRELYLDTLLQICRSESSFSDFYIFHDTNINSKSHLCEEILTFFSKFSFPDTSPGGMLTTNAHQGLAFDGLVLFVRSLSERRANPPIYPQLIPLTIEPVLTSRDASGSETDSQITPEILRGNKVRKDLFLQGAELFNTSFKKGIPFFQEHRFLPDPLTPESVARFFYTAKNLNKSILGEYLAKKQNADTLAAFSNLYNFDGKSIDEAMRLFLEKFRIPGEAQQIERIMEAFSKKYFSSIKDDPKRYINTEDDTCVLAFSIVLLNSDQHNPQVKRGIYERIKKAEIVLAEERGGDLGFNYEWKELLKSMSSVPRLSGRETNVFDKDMFVLTWPRILAATFYTFENCEDSTAFEKSLVLIQHTALLAVQYDLHEVLDHLIHTLIRITRLTVDSEVLPLEEDVANLTTPDNSESTGDQSPLLVKRRNTKPDRWAVQFGQNYRAQVATVLAFNLSNDFSDAVKKSWKKIIHVICNLYLHQLLPKSLLLAEHFCKSKVTIPRLLVDPDKLKSQLTSPKRESGFFSSFSQFLSLSSDYEEDFQDNQNNKYEQMALQCIATCGIEESLAETRFMEDDTLLLVMQTIIDFSYVNPATAKSDTNGDYAGVPSDNTTNYSQSSVFLLELLFRILLRNRDRLKKFWPLLCNHLTNIIRASSPTVLIERAVTNILRLLLRLTHVDEIQADVFKPLELLLELSSDTIHIFSEQVTAGFLAVAKTDMTILSKHSSRWSTLFRILSISATHPLASSFSFELTCLIISGHPDSPVTAEHFGECVDLLLSFSSGVIGPSSHVRNNSNNVTTTPAADLKITSPTSANIREPIRSQTSVALERALTAVEKLYNLHLIIPKLIDISGSQAQRAWFEFWLPVISGLGQQCNHPSIDIRHQALIYLQRLLLSEELAKAADYNKIQNRIECFDIILFPLFDELSIIDESLDLYGKDETRVRACGLIAKVFFNFSTPLQESKEYNRIWCKTLDYFGKLSKAVSNQRNGHAQEGIRESLKNMILVLMAEGTLIKPTGSDSIEDSTSLWALTWDRVNEYYPNLKGELIEPKPNAETIEVPTDPVAITSQD